MFCKYFVFLAASNVNIMSKCIYDSKASSTLFFILLKTLLKDKTKFRHYTQVDRLLEKAVYY